MKKPSALLLSLLLLLTACGTPGTPDDAVTPPTPNDEILVEEGLRAEDLPEESHRHCIPITVLSLPILFRLADPVRPWKTH